MSLSRTTQKPVIEEKITEHLSVGLFPDGKIMTMIDGVPFVQCRKAIIVQQGPEAGENLAQRLSNYKNFDEFLANRSKSESRLDFEIKVRPETELFVHKSTIQGWVESGYNIDVIDSNIAFPILIALQKHDADARNALFYEVERRWNEGSKKSRQALVLKVISQLQDGSTIDPVFFARFFKMVDDETKKTIAMSGLPPVLRRVLRDLGVKYENPKLAALSKFLGKPLVDAHIEGSGFDVDGAIYMVMTDEEADDYALERIVDDLQYFRGSFIDTMTGIDGLGDLISERESRVRASEVVSLLRKNLKAYSESVMYRGGNEAELIKKMIRKVKELEKSSVGGVMSTSTVVSAIVEINPGFDEFAKAAIQSDGRGHFISSYDGKEYEEKIENTFYYIYRTD